MSEKDDSASVLNLNVDGAERPKQKITKLIVPSLGLAITGAIVQIVSILVLAPNYCYMFKDLGTIIKVFVCSFVCVCLFVRSSVHLFVRSFVPSFVHSFVCSLGFLFSM